MSTYPTVIVQDDVDAQATQRHSKKKTLPPVDEVTFIARLVSVSVKLMLQLQNIFAFLKCD